METYKVTRGINTYQVVAKLGNMRKSQEFVIYPHDGETVTLQADSRMARFSLATGRGIMTVKGQRFTTAENIMPVFAPPELCAAILASATKGTQARTTIYRDGEAVYP